MTDEGDQEPPAEPTPEDPLSARAARADDEGYAALYRRWYRPLLGMVVALLGSQPPAEEVVQSAFASTFDRYHRLSDPAAATIRSAVRGAGAEKPRPDDPARPTERVLSAVRSLPRGEREAVALHASLGLSSDEIDHTLGLEPGTAGPRLDQAAERLRGALQVGDDLDYTIEAAFAERTAALGTVLARPGEAQRRVFRRRRARVAVAAGALVVLLVLAISWLGGGSGNESLDASDTTTTTAATVPGSSVDTAATTAATTPSTVEVDTTTTTSGSPPSTATEGGTYTVVSGDGWYAIAKKVDVPVESLLAANDATLSTPLFVGQVLKVPVVKTATTGA